MPKKVTAEIIGVRILKDVPQVNQNRFSIKFNLTVDDYTIQNKKRILDYNPDLSINDIKSLMEDLYR